MSSAVWFGNRRSVICSDIQFKDLSVVWNKDDRFTLFDNIVVGEEWAFEGEDGESGGVIGPVESHYYVGVDDFR